MIDKRKQIAIKRVQRAEDILFKVADLLEQAQTQLSVIVGAGVHTSYEKIGQLRRAAREQVYKLESVRAVGDVKTNSLHDR